MAGIPPNRDDDDAHLARLAAGGDKDAWGELIRRHQGRLLLAVDSRLLAGSRRHLDASDVVQSTWENAYPRVEEFVRRGEGDFSFWIYRIARDRTSDANRRYSRGVDGRTVPSFSPGASGDHLLELLKDSITSPGSAVARSELRSLLQEALWALSDTDRDVIIMRYWDQLKFGEIAEIIGDNEEAVTKRHARALVKLDKLLTRGHGGGFRDG